MLLLAKYRPFLSQYSNGLTVLWGERDVCVILKRVIESIDLEKLTLLRTALCICEETAIAFIPYAW